MLRGRAQSGIDFRTPATKDARISIDDTKVWFGTDVQVKALRTSTKVRDSANPPQAATATLFLPPTFA